MMCLIGDTFGLLTVVDSTDRTEKGHRVWKCRCACGNECFVNTRTLKRTANPNCGCLPVSTAKKGPFAEDVSNRRFGMLVALKRIESDNRDTRWLCRCDCGNLKTVATRNLKNGNVRSCGCMGTAYKEDLTGKQFGRLTVISKTNRRNASGSVMWKCRCICGNETDVSQGDLVHGGAVSCGCRQKELHDAIVDKLNYVENTCLEQLQINKVRKDNRLGVTGVSQNRYGSYEVRIVLQGRRYYLGSYHDFDEAVIVRERSKGAIHLGFQKAYADWKALASNDPDWAESHPFIYDVRVEDRVLFITDLYGTRIEHLA